MNKKLIAAVCVTTLSLGAFAALPRGPMGPGSRPPMHHAPMRPAPAPARPMPPPPPPRHHHHRSSVGASIAAGFVGGLVGGAIVDRPVVVTQPVVTQPVVTQPVVVQQPVVVPQPVTTVQNVWVEGRYIDQVQANGAVIRIWQPGHYEQRTVTVQ